MPSKKTLTAQEKSALTAKWAVTMAKWRIGFDTGGRITAGRTVPPSRRWNLVTFAGPGGRESRGVVDLLAIRKDHRIPPDPALKRGDLFEMILVQVKGGGTADPTAADIDRLKKVADRYGARDVLLATWKRQEELTLKRLDRTTGEWATVENPRTLFK